MALTTGFVALRLHDHPAPHGASGVAGGSAAGFGLFLLRISNTGIL